MPKIKLTIAGYLCSRCSHKWQKRKKVEPVVCPNCKSPYWDRPRGKKK